MTRPARARRTARPSSEAPILHSVRYSLASRVDVLLARNNVGVDTERGVRYGLGVGSADLVGVVEIDTIGVALYVEVKSPRGKLTDDQQRFKNAVVGKGAIHITTRSAEDAVAQLDAAIARVRAHMRARALHIIGAPL